MFGAVNYEVCEAVNLDTKRGKDVFGNGLSSVIETDAGRVGAWWSGVRWSGHGAMSG